MGQMINIDFGNSYTKVGVRTDGNELSTPLSDNVLEFDDGLNICIPTLAARVLRKGKEHWVYGSEILEIGNSQGVEVLRNWKPNFFNGSSTPLKGIPQAKIPAFATMKKLSESELQHFMDSLNLNEKQRAALEDLKNGEDEPDPGQTDLDTKEIGLKYFRWLRAFLEGICTRRGIDLRKTPTRINLPSFGAKTTAEDLLIEILSEAGWKIAPNHPALPEPVANAIGVFSEGRNILWRPKRTEDQFPDYPGMFGTNEFIKAARKRFESRYNQRMYWVLVVDLGGYTLDIAMVGFDLEEIDIPLNGKYQGKQRLATLSEKIGIRALDDKVKSILPEEKQKLIDELLQDPDPRRVEAFHRFLYQRGRPFHISRQLIGQKEEGEAIQEVVSNFAHECAKHVEDFITMHQYTRIDDVVMTGGGCNIPQVRDAIVGLLQGYRLKNAYVPALAAEEKNLPPKCQRLKPLLVRGATAIGGTSVFFDYNGE
ncbi:Hypothetical protein PBC10988_34280 [Planctomycetales bacterium 10988]|nr:Hypothetical protein PBC10988_34280 [Planctomycetales bacterium 10988]